MTFGEIAWTVWTRAGRTFDAARQRSQDASECSYGKFRSDASLARYLQAVPGDVLSSHVEKLAGLAENYLEHRFDLLGSGWMRVHYGMHCRGTSGVAYPPVAAPRFDAEGMWLEGRLNAANAASARRVWQLVDADYTPIDWQLDFKSGFRWSESTWYSEIRFATPPGADIKVPWELARMQHLPQLALAHMADVKPDACAREFRNQVLDFIATNPPRFGVNWRGTMDVAIRAVNCLVAYDLFVAAGASFDEAFKREFARSIYAHGVHVRTHLEWHPRYRSNHYLAHVVGLVFIGAYLCAVDEADEWLSFGRSEVIAEVGRQFNADGSSFEGSTCYHRLSSEMALWATVIACAVSERRTRAEFPESHWQRLARAAVFTRDVTRSDGQVVQIGDNDSGRFLKLDVTYEKLTVSAAKARYTDLVGYDELPDHAIYWDENVLDHRALVRDIAAVIDGEDAPGGPPSSVILHRLCSAVRVQAPISTTFACDDDATWNAGTTKLASLAQAHRSVCEFAAEPNLTQELYVCGYRDFGLYVFSSSRLFLAVRCGHASRDEIGAHAHNDLLAIELTIDDRDIARDPGTYLYTADPAQRNAYRSISAHAAPQIAGREPTDLVDLFELRDRGRAKTLYVGPRGFIGVHYGFGDAVYRKITILTDRIQIEDISLAGSLAEDWLDRRVAFSGKYGFRLR